MKGDMCDWIIFLFLCSSPSCVEVYSNLWVFGRPGIRSF